MRLVCPNCEAKYEVPDDAIPDTGRDVQCASCGHAWYQMRPRSGAAEAAVAATVEPEAEAPEIDDALAETTSEDETLAGMADDSVVAAEVEPEPEAGLAPEPEAETEVAPEPAPEPEPELDPAPEVEAETSEAVDAVAEAETVESTVAPDLPAMDAAVVDIEAAVDEAVASDPEQEPEAQPTPQDETEAAPDLVAESKAAYAVDDSVLAILREEAERETNARRAEARPLEVQTDLGIESAVAAAANTETPVLVETAVEDKPSARRDLLPDVEEINSTLRPSETESAADDLGDGGIVAQRNAGFRSGFLWVMTIAIFCVGLYLAAPPLSRAVPSLAGPLDAYVEMINGLRLELDGLMRSATLALDSE